MPIIIRTPQPDIEERLVLVREGDPLSPRRDATEEDLARLKVQSETMNCALPDRDLLDEHAEVLNERDQLALEVKTLKAQLADKQKDVDNELKMIERYLNVRADIAYRNYTAGTAHGILDAVYCINKRLYR